MIRRSSSSNLAFASADSGSAGALLAVSSPKMSNGAAIGPSQRLLVNLLVRRGDEGFEQRMRLVRLAQELRVKLAREEKRVVRQLDDFDELAVGGHAAP